MCGVCLLTGVCGCLQMSSLGSEEAMSPTIQVSLIFFKCEKKYPFARVHRLFAVCGVRLLTEVCVGDYRCQAWVVRRHCLQPYKFP